MALGVIELWVVVAALLIALTRVAALVNTPVAALALPATEYRALVGAVGNRQRVTQARWRCWSDLSRHGAGGGVAHGGEVGDRSNLVTVTPPEPSEAASACALTLPLPPVPVFRTEIRPAASLNVLVAVSVATVLNVAVTVAAAAELEDQRVAVGRRSQRDQIANRGAVDVGRRLRRKPLCRRPRWRR